MPRINYPDSWSQHYRDELDAMFTEARAKGLWFCIHTFLVGPMWFSPDELEAQQKNGKFIWSAENWRLRHPSEHLAEADTAVRNATVERDRIAARVNA